MIRKENITLGDNEKKRGLIEPPFKIRPKAVLVDPPFKIRPTKVLVDPPFKIRPVKVLVDPPFRIRTLEEEIEYRRLREETESFVADFVKLEESKVLYDLEKNALNTIQQNCEEFKNKKVKVLRKPPFKIDLTNTPEVDRWMPTNPDDEIFRTTESRIYAPLHIFFNMSDNSSIDFFNLKAKRCYNSDNIRQQFVQYINYFEKYYDPEHELLINYSHIKYMIDYVDKYTQEDLFDDIFKYIFTPVMLTKIDLMVKRNYKFNLNNGKKTNNVSLQYTDAHAILLLNFSMMQKFTIPLVSHYIAIRKYPSNEINDALMSFYYRILAMFKSVDMMSKLYETVMSSVKRSKKKNKLWDMQNIRSINPTTHTIESVENIPLQLSPKYKFNQHIISFNFSAIRQNIGYKILDISYNYTFVPLSSSLRDEDNNSKIDKYEANLEKTDENMHMFIKANKMTTMKAIMNHSGLGPITDEEIDFYRKELTKNGGQIMNRFQQELVNLSVYKYFGDPITSKFTNKDEYIALMIASKRLLSSYFVIIHEIIGGRVVRLVDRKSINKKDMEKVKASPTWQKIVNLFRNPAKEEQVMSYMAIILSSEFAFISYDDPELNGQKIELQPEVICEEFMRFILISAGSEARSYFTEEAKAKDSNRLKDIEDIPVPETHRDVDKFASKAWNSNDGSHVWRMTVED